MPKGQHSGRRGAKPMPTIVREMEGNRSKRPMPTNEPQFTAGVPDQPAGMSAGAKRVWAGLIPQMAISGVLRQVDWMALQCLCEDWALLIELKKGLEGQAREIEKQAKKAGKPIPGNAKTAMASNNQGRRLLASIRELETQVHRWITEFGLTPSSSAGVMTADGSGKGRKAYDPLEAALCG